MFVAMVHGFILAFGLILPLGVQNVFIFNQGVTQTRITRALPVIITASICDTLLILIAVMGVSVMVFGVPLIKISLLIVGILFLMYMGFVIWKSEHRKDASMEKALSPKKQIVFAASVSLLNPHAIMDTIGVIGTSSLSYNGVEKLGFAIACILVSWIWFFSLAVIGRQAGKLTNSKRFVDILNKISAIIMWGTAIYLLSSFF